MLKLKVFFAISLFLNLTMGIIKAQDLGKIEGLEEVNQVYLSVACTALPEFRRVLESYNTDHLPIEITPDEKKRWVEKHLSGCRSGNTPQLDLSRINLKNTGCALSLNGEPLQLGGLKKGENFIIPEGTLVTSQCFDTSDK